MKLEIMLPDQCLCRADPVLMETVLRNVLVNAVRYSPENERICVKLYDLRKSPVKIARLFQEVLRLQVGQKILHL